MSRFPPPWSVEELHAAFVIKDGTGRYFGRGVLPVAQGA
jgi:hypothetical protein